MFIGRKKIGIVGETDNPIKIETKYKTPEILMIDCDKGESDKLKEKGFNIELGSFVKKYIVLDSSCNKKVIFNNNINNIIEKDIVIIDMSQKETHETYELMDLYYLEEGQYITTYKNQKESCPAPLR